jgi:hypothetical protein
LPFVPLASLAFARLRAKVARLRAKVIFISNKNQNPQRNFCPFVLIFIRIAELKTRTAKARVGLTLGQLKSKGLQEKHLGPRSSQVNLRTNEMKMGPSSL